MNQAYIDGMEARSNGGARENNPHTRAGSEPQDYDDWTNGWESVNTHVEMMITNAKAMKSQIAESVDTPGDIAMSDEANDLSNEQVHEMHHHAEGGAGWIKFAALTAAILATLAAISGSMASKRLTESSRAQIQSNNQWSYYQSKSIKHHMAEMEKHIMRAIPHEPAGVLFEDSKPKKPESEKDIADKIAKYEKQLEEIKAKAERLDDESEHFLHAHEILEHGETFFHVAIATIAICLLTKRRFFFVLSLALCAVGIYFFIHGIILHIG